jgi:hypothetical protein
VDAYIDVELIDKCCTRTYPPGRERRTQALAWENVLYTDMKGGALNPSISNCLKVALASCIPESHLDL